MGRFFIMNRFFSRHGVLYHRSCRDSIRQSKITAKGDGRSSWAGAAKKRVRGLPTLFLEPGHAGPPGSGRLMAADGAALRACSLLLLLLLVVCGVERAAADPCPAGQTGPEGSCTDCAAGKWKAGNGSDACDTCAECQAGKYREGCALASGGYCAECPAGTYKDANASTPCTSCPLNSTSVKVPGVLLTQRADCKCTAGSHGAHGVFEIALPDADFSDAASPASWFNTSMSGQNSLPHERIQLRLSVEWMDSSDTCAAGSSGLYAKLASHGTWTSISGQAPSGLQEEEVTLADDQLTAEGNSVLAPPYGDLVLQIGYTTGAGAGCRLRLRNATLMITTLDSGCVSCPGNTSSLDDARNVTGCKCNEGYTGPDGGVCAACQRGTYKNVTGPHLTFCVCSACTRVHPFTFQVPTISQGALPGQDPASDDLAMARRLEQLHGLSASIAHHISFGEQRPFELSAAVRRGNYGSRRGRLQRLRACKIQIRSRPGRLPAML